MHRDKICPRTPSLCTTSYTLRAYSTQAYVFTPTLCPATLSCTDPAPPLVRLLPALHKPPLALPRRGPASRASHAERVRLLHREDAGVECLGRGVVCIGGCRWGVVCHVGMAVRGEELAGVVRTLPMQSAVALRDREKIPNGGGGGGGVGSCPHLADVERRRLADPAATRAEGGGGR